MSKFDVRGRSFHDAATMSESMQRLLLATRNAHKVREVREILGDGWIVEDLSVLPNLAEVEETGATFEENARIKALAASPLYDGWTLADDSGLEVDVLGGEPGVRSARYAGDEADMARNRLFLMSKMCGVIMRTARFRCVLVLAKNGAVAHVFSGAVEGRIAEEERGEEGFGYDSMFIPQGCDRTFAEMTSLEKHALSHRGRALDELAKFFCPNDFHPA